MARTRTLRTLPAVRRSLVTCWHSSRVGTTTRACGASVSCSGLARPASTSAGTVTRSRSGRPKPSVLPVPVLAWPMTSRAGEGDGERHLLDGEGGDDADGFEGLGRLGKNSEIAESRSQGSCLFCVTRCEASAGVVSGPGRELRPPHGRAEWHGTTADARALVPLRVPPNSVRIVPYGRGGLSGRSRSGHRPGILIRVARRDTSFNSAGALPLYPGIAHMRWPIRSRSGRHTD